jgi:hypothetical protein
MPMTMVRVLTGRHSRQRHERQYFNAVGAVRLSLAEALASAE